VLQVETTRFGKIEIQDRDVLSLSRGLIGFPELKRYVLLDHDENSPFKWLQSLDDGNIAFVLINPLLFKPDYMVEVPEAEVSELDLEKEEDAVISVVITMPTNPHTMTANLRAPLVFNIRNRKGKQIILSRQEYTTRHNIMLEVKRHIDREEQSSATEEIKKPKDKQEDSQEDKKVGSF